MRTAHVIWSEGNRHLKHRWTRGSAFVVSAAFTLALLVVPAVGSTSGLSAQSFPTGDPVIERIWELGMDQSQAERLAQVLTDYIGPRLHGSSNLAKAQDWLLETYERWGVNAWREDYGTWVGWEHGALHVDLVAPRRQTLDARLLAYSAGTEGAVEGDVIPLPTVAPLGADPAEWLPRVRGKWVLLSPPDPTCRTPEQLEAHARRETVEGLAERRAENEAWLAGWIEYFGRDLDIRYDRGWGFIDRLVDAGALGVIESWWFGVYGSYVIQYRGRADRPDIVLSCEDYGLLYRLAVNDQRPRLRVDAEVMWTSEVPQFNVIAELKGVERPEEYVVLSAHLDSWHGATGATNNATGAVTILEAMRLLADAYPNPRRTILAGHWAGEEPSGPWGAKAFVEDHPEIVDGIQAVFNQDNGTWRIERIEGQGFLDAGAHIGRWISLVPREISDHIHLEFPGSQSHAGSDHVAFLCAGAPAFRLQSNYDDYDNTHHGKLDTYDKIIFDDLKENATLTAMLAYAASEDPERMGRDRALLPIDPETGQPKAWQWCLPAMRAPTESLLRGRRQ